MPNLVLHSKDFPSADYEKANHHPVAIVAKDAGTKIIYKTIKAGRSLLLDVSRSYDSDGFYRACAKRFRAKHQDSGRC